MKSANTNNGLLVEIRENNGLLVEIREKWTPDGNMRRTMDSSWKSSKRIILMGIHEHNGLLMEIN